jgi:cell division protein FtsQ
MKLAVYRRDNCKRSQRERRRRLLAAAMILFLTVATVAVHKWGGQIKGKLATFRSLVVENPYFAVREIQVRGGTKVGGREVVAMAGLRHGMSIWKIDPVAIENKIAAHPWVRRVLVRREFPRRVLIEVEERVPKAIIAAGKLYYVDGDGVVFKEVGEDENVNFPILTGLHPAELATPDPAVRQKIRDALRLSELMTRDSHTLSEIHFDAADRLVLYTVKFPVALHMGWGNWEKKIRLLDRVLSLWKEKETGLVSLDVSFRDQVIARLR